MAKDDFIRIKYTREVDGRKKRSSVSVDPDLFEIFAKIRGTVPAARAVLREWAVAVDADRQWQDGLGVDGGIGLSRMVQRRMFFWITTMPLSTNVLISENIRLCTMRERHGGDPEGGCGSAS